MKTFFVCCALFGSLLATIALPAQAQTDTPPATETAPKPLLAEPKVQSVFDTLMGAIEDNSYTSFLTVVDDDFKAVLTKPLFESVVKQVAPRQKKGYEPTYFGSINRQGYRVHFWKLVFNDKDDDLLAELALKDEKVGGFMLR